LLEIHGSAIAKNELIHAKFKLFVESSESRIATYNALCKLSSRVDLILNQQSLMLSTRNAQLAPQKSQEDESSGDSSEELSTDDEHVAFASTNPNWQDSDFLGEPSPESSEYESGEAQTNSVIHEESSDCD
ncbi:hypothetical protein L0F63_005413, partial [Massospora cicadina]